MEPEVSLPYSQQPTAGPYPEPDESSPHPPTLRSILILLSHLGLGLSRGLYPSGFVTKIAYAFHTSPLRATCPAHLVFHISIFRCLGCSRINWTLFRCKAISRNVCRVLEISFSWIIISHT